MTAKRLTGSYYTPIAISEFIIKRVLEKNHGDQLEILEPSAGDGVFIRSLYQNDQATKRILKTHAIELNEVESDKIRKQTKHQTLKVKSADFLVYQQQLSNKKFDIVIGNPPYIKKNLLSSEQITLCQDIHALFPQLSTSSIKNIWSAFLIRSISLLKNNGILSLVLPAELLQVNFTSELRKLLVSEFQRIEIFTFNELLFKECKGQDTLVLIAEKISEKPGLFFHNVVKVDELKKDSFKFTQKDIEDDSKWTSHCLTKDEIKLLDKLKKGLKIVSELCDSKAGIVTGANEFFILGEECVARYNLQKYAKPIIQKGAFVKSWIAFKQKNHDELVRGKNPCFLIDFNKAVISKSSKANEYLLDGESLKINERYKTQFRERWYDVPNITASAKGLFFKRCHDIPKFIVNEAKVLATDSAYFVNPKQGIEIRSLVLSFYNSLTLIFSELYGRFYGGGVLELTPNEFKKLPIPYIQISNAEYSMLVKLFPLNASFDERIRQLDNFILRKAIPNITDAEMDVLDTIRLKLISRRQRL